VWKYHELYSYSINIEFRIDLQIVKYKRLTRQIYLHSLRISNLQSSHPSANSSFTEVGAELCLFFLLLLPRQAGVPAAAVENPCKQERNTVEVVKLTRVWLMVLSEPKKNLSLWLTCIFPSAGVSRPLDVENRNPKQSKTNVNGTDDFIFRGRISELSKWTFNMRD